MQWNIFSHKKECLWVNSNEIDEPRAYYTEWIKSERQILYTNPYIWNLERWYWWTYLRGSNGDADLWTQGEKGRGDEWREQHGNIYITVSKTDSQWGFAAWGRELKLVLCDNLEEWDGKGGERELQEGGDICIPMADSSWCMAETNTIL